MDKARGAAAPVKPLAEPTADVLKAAKMLVAMKGGLEALPRGVKRLRV
jgi:hypothetical protein